MRRSPRFTCHIGQLCPEVLALICLELDLASLSRLHRTSKAFKAFIESELVLRKICIGEGHLGQAEHLSDGNLIAHLQRQGYSKEELTSYWSLLAAKSFRSLGLPFRSDGKVPFKKVPSLCRAYDFIQLESQGNNEQDPPRPNPSYEVHDFKFDPLRRVVITTSYSGGGLRVTCLDTGALLWHDETIPSRSFLGLSDGMVVTCQGSPFAGPGSQPPSQIQLWLFKSYSSAEAASERGRLNKLATIQCSATVRALGFHHPYLAAVTSESRLIVFNIAQDQRMLHDLDVTPRAAPEPGVGPWLPQCVSFDEQNYFVTSTAQNSAEHRLMHRWCLQVISRKTEQVVWQFDAADLAQHLEDTSSFGHPRQQEWYFGSRDNNADQLKTGWDYSAMLRPRPETPPTFDTGDPEHDEWLREFTIKKQMQEGPNWFYGDEAFAVHYDIATGCLCLLVSTTLVIFPQYRSMLLDSEHRCEPIVLWFAADDFGSGLPILRVANGLALFTIDNSFVMIDLQRVLAGHTKGTIIRFLPVSLQSCMDRDLVGCIGLEMNETMVVFSGMTDSQDCGRDVMPNPLRTYVGVLNFAELGKLRTSRSKEKHGIIWPSSIDTFDMGNKKDQDDQMKKDEAAAVDAEL